MIEHNYNICTIVKHRQQIWNTFVKTTVTVQRKKYSRGFLNPRLPEIILTLFSLTKKKLKCA